MEKNGKEKMFASKDPEIKNEDIKERKAIGTDEMREKLRNLEKYLPEQEETIYRLGDFFAERLKNPEIVPEGFVMMTELALYDLQQGIDGFTGQPIRSGLVGYPPMIYILFKMSVPQIAKAVCPSDFATEVKRITEEIKK